MNPKNGTSTKITNPPLKFPIEEEHPIDSLFNLIIYTENPQRTDYFKAVIKMIIQKYPCRIIFIQAINSGSIFQMNAAKETMIAGESVRCDQISIESSPDYFERIPFVLLPLFVSDLPIYLMWGEDPTKDKQILPRLKKMATRLIFDADCAENLKVFSSHILEESKTATLTMIDMAWARTGRWRSILGHTFDSKERLDQLNSAHNIKMVYNNRSSDIFLHPQTQALYLQAWLASSLGWTFSSKEMHDQNFVLNYKTPKGNIKILLEPQSKQHFDSEELLSIDISDENQFLYSFVRSTDSQVVAHCSTTTMCELPSFFPMSEMNSNRACMQDIFYRRPSKKYIDMLTTLQLCL